MIDIKTKRDDLTNSNIYTFINKEKNQILKWYLGSNGDLYWNLVNFRKQDNQVFEIPIEDFPLYQIMLNLTEEIKSGQIFINDSEFNISHNNVNNYMNARFITSEIYHQKYDECVWFSDDKAIPNTNSVWIKKEDNSFRITFNNVEDTPSTQIRFKTSGSFYGPGYLPFLRAYRRIDKIKDNYNMAVFDENEVVVKQKVYEIKREV